MSQTSTAQQLYVVALQDLLDGERAWVERLPELHGKAEIDLQDFIDDELARARAQAERLRSLLASCDTDEPMPNIWLRANLDDAARDAETIASGPLRSIALAGAFRKAKQSERVSYETAIALAQQLGHGDAVDDLTAIRGEEAAADAELAKLLRATCATLDISRTIKEFV